MEAPGDVVEFVSSDQGEKKYLGKLTVPTTLWLKKGCPVILLRNLSGLLVNGLRGNVTGFGSEGPIVEFPSISLTTEIKKAEFSVYSPQLRKNLATRVQIPLKLGYALTVHKAQGMTLDSAEIDCRDIFKAGQLGVAIGRVRTVEGLRVINFQPRFCLPQPESIKMFLQEPFNEPQDDLKCCKHDRSLENVHHMFTVDAEFDPYDEDPSEDQFDQEFDEILKGIGTEEPALLDLPEGFSFTSLLESIKPSGAILTSKMQGVHDIITNLDQVAIHKLQIFCHKEFLAVNEIIDEMNIDEPVPVKPENLAQFYRKVHEHQTSVQYRLNCMSCFKDENLTECHWYILYNVFVAIRKFILDKKSRIFPTSERDISNREINEASKARIRYVGGYCVTKVRQEQLSILKQTMYSTSIKGQTRYQQANDSLKILNSFREEEEHLKSTSADPSSLMDTIRKQYVNKGLTHISDPLFFFFVALCELCLKLLVDRNFNEAGEKLHEQCCSEILKSKPLREQYVKICSTYTDLSTTQVFEEDIHSAVCATMDHMLTTVSIMELLFQMLIKKFLFIMLCQFRSDLLQSFSVAKTMSHRKQVQIRKEKQATMKSLTYKSIEDDITVNKQMSHSLLKGFLMKKTPIFNSMTKLQISKLCTAYGIKTQRKQKKGELSDILSATLLQSSGMTDSSVLHQVNPEEPYTAEPQASTVSTSAEPSTSVYSTLADPQDSMSVEHMISAEPNTPAEPSSSDEPQPSTSAEPSIPTGTDEVEVCKVCQQVGKNGVEWIECASCKLWLHRHCAKLKLKRKWEYFMKEGVDFFCSGCS